MTLLGHGTLLFFSGFAQYLLQVDKGNNFGLFLMLALPIGGVYFLGWWALITVFVGVLIGARVFIAAMQHKNSLDKQE